MSNILTVIPARLGSTRLPRKPLLPIHGKPLVQWVWERALATDLGPVIVATDDHDIARTIQDLGGIAILTDSDLASGTDRVAVAARTYDPAGRYGLVINLQGDMPFIDPQVLGETVEPLRYHDISSLVYDMDPADVANLNSVKAIVSWRHGDIGTAHWFTRAPIAYGYHHAGIYGYHRDILERFVLAEPSEMENIERLEQLRAFSLGFSIGVKRTGPIAGEINTPEDLVKANLVNMPA